MYANQAENNVRTGGKLIQSQSMIRQHQLLIVKL